ncbi:MAG TPA: DMT family transporter [Candidatus Limnocylindria bacterium]|nr:DMT family transporter [Candidatus Limnocylindria bacterium]
MRRPSSSTVGALLIVAAAAGFGTLGPMAHYADEAGVSSLALVTWRAGVGAVIVLLFLGAQAVAGRGSWRRWRDMPRLDRMVLAIAAATNAALNMAAFVAFLRIGIALTLLIFYVYPAFVALASMTWFGERLDRVRWAALALSMAGVVLVVVGAGELGSLDALGIGLALAAALAQTFYALAAHHWFRAVPGVQAAASTMGGAAILYLAAALVIGQPAVVLEPIAGSAALWPVLVAGVVGAGLPTVCFIRGIRLLGAPRATILATLEPVVGVGLAAILFGTLPTALQVAGGTLIIAAGIVLQLRPSGEIAEHEAVAEPSA